MVIPTAICGFLAGAQLVDVMLYGLYRYLPKSYWMPRPEAASAIAPANYKWQPRYVHVVPGST